jgi:hypothetical protein
VAVILNDEEHTKWTTWDYKLVKAHYILQDWYRDGIPVWWDESERVAFDAKARVSKSRAAVERAQETASKGGKKPVPGRYFIAEPKVIDGGDWPTRAEWFEEQERKSGINTSISKFGSDARRPNVVQGRK